MILNMMRWKMNKYNWKEEFDKSKTIKSKMNYDWKSDWESIEKDKSVLRRSTDDMDRLFYHSNHTVLGKELDELLINYLFALHEDEFGNLKYIRYLHKNNIQYKIIVTPVNNKMAELRVYNSLGQAICVMIEFEDKQYTRVADFSLAINKAFKSLEK